ncbi:unnamed protein product [Tilletia laevis]|nr:unnamed protein product [Tilletia caries]CAD6920501.1 unnamed protein product [Tilletia laevis]
MIPLEPLVRLTPLERATNLSARLGCEVLLKREDLQPFFSFKLRGAFNMMRQLTPEQKWKGLPCTIVMPTGTPEIKSANVARLGAKVVLFGQDFDAAKAECTRLANAHGLTIIHHLRLRREISIFSRLRFVAERADLGERREAMVVVAMDEVSARLSWGNGWA